jgi:hypothetical protein
MRRTFTAACVTMLLLISGAVAVPAAVARETAEQHCAFYLHPLAVQTTPGTVAATPVPLGCFPTVAQAVAAGTNGAVEIPATTPGGGLTQQLLDEGGASTSANYLLGQEFDYINYCCATAGQFVEYFAGGSCVGTTWVVNYVTDAWNDRFESGKGFSSCDHNKKFQDSNLGDPVKNCTPNCSTYQALRNEVSSLKWAD